MKYSIGVDIGGTNLRVALVNDTGEIVDSLRESTPVKKGPEFTAQLIGQLIKNIANPSKKIEGVGIGCPGPLSRKERTIFQTPNLPGFENFPLGKRIETISGFKTFLDNDAKCAGYGEGRFGVARKTDNYILLTFGTGIGGAVVAGGKMIYGKNDGACEIGHMTLYPDGLPCACGNRGCFEQYCSATALSRRAEERTGKPASGADIFAASQKGEDWALNSLKLVAKDLAIATASLVNIFEPQMIVFGGGIFTEGGGPITQWVREEIRGRCFESSQKGLRIEASSLRGNAGILGAAAIAMGD
jgi:glucokinase